jgi:hypothetical protein
MLIILTDEDEGDAITSFIVLLIVVLTQVDLYSC